MNFLKSELIKVFNNESESIECIDLISEKSDEESYKPESYESNYYNSAASNDKKSYELTFNSVFEEDNEEIMSQNSDNNPANFSYKKNSILGLTMNAFI